MKLSSKRPIRKQLYTAIATALALGASVVMSSHAQEGETDPVPSLDVDIVLVETPGGETLPGDVPEIGELPEEVEPLPTLPGGIALDNDGNAYPEGGPAGLYNAIVDKQQKLGMTGVYDAEGNLVDVVYEGGNHGQQNALSRLRANLERKLNKLDDGTEVPEVVEPLPEEVVELAEIPEALEDVPADELVPVPALPEGVALDSDGNAYPEGGPAGLYNAIADKQQKLGMTGVYDAEGNLVDVVYEGGNQGQQNALSRLRANLERKLNKLDDGTEVPEVVEPLPEELAVSAELGISTQSVKINKLKVEKSPKPEKAVKLERVTKVERVEKIAKPTRVERVERPQKPTKITRVEKPQRPEKISRVEKPQKPEKVARVEKPQRPQKPQKPEKPAKPERPGRS